MALHKVISIQGKIKKDKKLVYNPFLHPGQFFTFLIKPYSERRQLLNTIIFYLEVYISDIALILS